VSKAKDDFPEPDKPVITINLFRGKKIGLSVVDVVNFRSTSTTKLIHTISLTVNINIKSKVI
jgi:hypothetical protein